MISTLCPCGAMRQMSLVQFLGVVMALSTAVVASTTAEQTLLANFGAVKARINEQAASCILVAAELSPCLSVCSPLSRLTTMEEASCCTTLLLFKETGCYCLAQESLHELCKVVRCALRKRLSQLAVAILQCGGEAVTCFAPEMMAHSVISEASEEAFASNKILEADLKRFYGVSADQPCQEIEGCGGSSNPVKSSSKWGQKNALLSHMTAYIKQVVTIIDASNTDDKVKTTVELEVDIAKSDVSPNDTGSFKASWRFSWSCFFILILLTMLLIWVNVRPVTLPPPSPCRWNGQEIVVAAEEFQSLQNLESNYG